MEKGEVRQTLNLDELDAVRLSDSDLTEIGMDTADEIGMDHERLMASGFIKITEHPLSSEINPAVIGENVLKIIWFRDTPVGISLETRNDYNKTVQQSSRFGVPEWRRPM